MTVVSIFAAFLVFFNYLKLNEIDKKIAEVDDRIDKEIAKIDDRIDVETYMRHLSSGIRYQEVLHRDEYALIEFKYVLTSKNDACCLSANYYMGLLYKDRYVDNNNPIYFKDAEMCLKRAIQFAPDIDPIIHNDSYASLGCLYGLGAVKDFYGAFRDDYINKSEKLLQIAIEGYKLAVHYKNMAITYTLKRNVKKAIEYIEKGIQMDADEKGIADNGKRKENAKIFFDKLFSKEEKELIFDTYKEIEKHFVSEYDTGSQELLTEYSYI